MRLLEWLKSKLASDHRGDEEVAKYVDKPRPVVTAKEFQKYSTRIILRRVGMRIVAKSATSEAFFGQNVVDAIHEAARKKPVKIFAYGLSRADIGRVNYDLVKSGEFYPYTRNISPDPNTDYNRYEILVVKDS